MSWLTIMSAFDHKPLKAWGRLLLIMQSLGGWGHLYFGSIFGYNLRMAINVLRIPSLTYDRVHEYRVGPSGAIEHRWTLQEGGQRSDGTSEWVVATNDFIRTAVCHAQSHVRDWFQARGISCERISALIEEERRTKKPTRGKTAPVLVAAGRKK